MTVRTGHSVPLDSAGHLFEEIGGKTALMSDLARSGDWEALLDVVRDRQEIIARCLDFECAPEEKRALLLELQSLLLGDSALIERCAEERDATLDKLECMGQANKVSHRYQLA